ncbi:MAG: flavin reductase family protein [Chloroflexota bacterium]|nr:flavin reductase family protein [Chloroflexota bacterium]
MSDLLTFLPGEMSGGAAYHMLNAIIAPRPISWISTVSADGTPNLAPHSYTTVASPNPPIVMFTSVGRKDTLRNVEASGEFVYNVGSRALVERINRTAADFPPEVNEFAWAGLTPLPGTLIKPPRVAEAPVQMECRLVEVRQVAQTSNYLVLGEVLAIHVDPAIMVDNRIDPALLDPVGRLAGSAYATFGTVFKLERPTWAGLQEAGDKPMEPL